MKAEDNSVNVVICGPAGQGIVTSAKLLTAIACTAGYHTFSTREYMSRIRGGSNSADVRISNMPVEAPVDRVDILIALDDAALKHMQDRIHHETVVVLQSEQDQLNDSATGAHEADLSAMARSAGNILYANSASVGVACGALGFDQDLCRSAARDFFHKRSEKVIQGNLDALSSGYGFGRGIALPDVPVHGTMKKVHLLDGKEAVGMGAIAGGVRFLASYPMSPSTGVMTFLAANSDEFELVVEQAEDEIAAVNMCIGAWYAGTRAMATTSGGGLALMSEGISLAGVTETPLVIHLAQRPGPATGLPTRTSQEDLNLVLHAGHGEFPRIILAPGTVRQAFELSAEAFHLAERFQVPVFILTDQYLMTSMYPVTLELSEKLTIPTSFVRSTADYIRYSLSEGPVSPISFPGHGEGLVCVDSHEHDQQGRITEDFATRTAMVGKRLAKKELIVSELPPPEVTGKGSYCIVCWGSTRNACLEAVSLTGREDVRVIHFSRVYPFPVNTGDHFHGAERIISVENNATGQFARLLQAETGVRVDSSILRYDGLPFRVDTLTGRIAEELEAK